MSSYSLKCAIKSIDAVQTVGNGFQKREVFLGFVSGNNKDQICKFELVGDKVNLLDGKRPGDIVTVHFNLIGREWNNSAFNMLQIWKVD